MINLTLFYKQAFYDVQEGLAIIIFLGASTQFSSSILLYFKLYKINFQLSPLHEAYNTLAMAFVKLIVMNETNSKFSIICIILEVESFPRDYAFSTISLLHFRSYTC